MVILLVTTLSWAGTAVAEPLECTEDHFGETIHSDLVVPTGEVCRIQNSEVFGTITVSPGSRLVVNRSTVNGSILATDASVQILQDNHVTHNVVTRRPQPVDGVLAFGLCRSAIGGSLIVRDTVGVQQLFIGTDQDFCLGNTIGGTLTYVNNQVAAHQRIMDNVIGGHLLCQGNAPPPEVSGNTVGGHTIGQC
ncbi:MAG: hypothetical protein AB1673_15855 [Actinomycetota bacterium]